MTEKSLPKLNDFYIFLDSSWSKIFPEQYLEYTMLYKQKNSAKIKVIQIINSLQFVVSLMGITTIDGKILVPVNVTKTIDMDILEEAIKLNLGIRRLENDANRKRK